MGAGSSEIKILTNGDRRGHTVEMTCQNCHCKWELWSSSLHGINDLWKPASSSHYRHYFRTRCPTCRKKVLVDRKCVTEEIKPVFSPSTGTPFGPTGNGKLTVTA